jgi:hypothetical protein
MTSFDVEIVLKGRDFAVTEKVTIPYGDITTWDETAAYDALAEILRAIERAGNPDAPRDRAVLLTGFSWIVEPEGDRVVIAIEIPSGAAVAGPFTIDAAQLDGLITRTIKLDRVAHQGPQGQRVH